jgi:hypothetical protein
MLGGSVSINSDATTVAAGMPSGKGAVLVWIRSGTTWIQQGGLLTGSDASTSAETGYSVSVSGDGNTIATGAIKQGKGAVYVFVRTETTWTQQGPKLTPSTTSSKALFGISVSLSNDGDLLAVGAPLDASGMTWYIESILLRVFLRHHPLGCH